jgi:type IV pilus assembly protein PilC
VAQFQYKAMDPRGKLVTGTMEAANAADLELRLGRMALDVIRSREVQRSIPRFGTRAIKRRDLITFCLHMEQLTSAGVPIIEGLSDLRDSLDHPRFREVITAVIESIQGGATLSDAMGAVPKVFPGVMLSLIRAGEQTGRLSDVFKNLTENLKWQDEQMAMTRKLLTYPAIVGTVVIGVIFFLMIYLVPQLLSFVTAMGKEIPLHTKALIAVSNGVAEYWYLVILVPVALVALASYLARVNPAVRATLDDWKLRFWVIGPILKKSLLARFSNYFALMYGAGIPVLDSLKVSEDIVGNRALGNAIERAGRQIADGASLSGGFESAGVFPPLVLRMLRVGESTGALEDAMRQVGYFYSRDVRESVDRLQSLIEPTMTLFLGAILAWVMFSVLGPIYDLITQIKI